MHENMYPLLIEFLSHYGFTYNIIMRKTFYYQYEMLDINYTYNESTKFEIHDPLQFLIIIDQIVVDQTQN